MSATQADYNRIHKEFQSYYQTTISSLKDGHPTLAGLQDNVIINMQFDALWYKIPKTQRVYDFEKLTEYQKSVFYKALIQQLYYVLTEGDFTASTGYNVDTNTFISPEAMERMAISPAARATLKEGGLLYTGLNGYGAGVHCPHHGRRWF